MRHLILFGLLLSFGNIHADETTSLSTEKFIGLSLTKHVDLESTDYHYILEKTCFHGRLIELTDGTVWEIVKPTSEVRSFYANEEQKKDPTFSEDISKNWVAGDKIIFHKVFDRNSYLIFNVTKNDLLAGKPIVPPRIDAALTFIGIEGANIALSDGSLWEFVLRRFTVAHLDERSQRVSRDFWVNCLLLQNGAALTSPKVHNSWRAGDPILVVHDTPWNIPLYGGNTHQLVNLRKDLLPRYWDLGTWSEPKCKVMRHLCLPPYRAGVKRL